MLRTLTDHGKFNELKTRLGLKLKALQDQRNDTKFNIQDQRQLRSLKSEIRLNIELLSEVNSQLEIIRELEKKEALIIKLDNDISLLKKSRKNDIIDSNISLFSLNNSSNNWRSELWK